MTKVVEYTYHTPAINSEVIKAVWYSSTARELYVKLPNGQIAGYADVSPLAFDRFMDAPSKGQRYNSHIKNVYKGIDGSVEFRAASGLAKKTAAPGVYSSWHSNSVLPPVTVAPAKPKQRFTINGTILKPTAINEVVEADSFEEAITKFREKYKAVEPVVQGVRVH